MERTESIATLADALAHFEAEVQNPKNTAVNPFHKNSYAPLQDVLSYVRPLLATYGLTVTQLVHSEGETIGVTTMLLHQSGEYIADTATMHPGTEKGKSAAQVAGSVVTYLRRYALAAILGIASEDDDDGNAAVVNGSNNNAAPKQRTEPIQKNGKQLGEEIKAELDELKKVADKSEVEGYREESTRAYKARNRDELQSILKRIIDHRSKLNQQNYADKKPAADAEKEVGTDLPEDLF